MMKFHFNPNYVTADGIFEVEVNMDSLILEPTKHAEKWVIAKDSTSNYIDVYNTKTDKISNKGCYINSKGLYFKGCGKRYFLKDLKPING